MDIDSMTIGEFKQLEAMFRPQSTAPKQGCMVGKYCIVRTRIAGVVAGVILAHEGMNVTVQDGRRLWRWAPAKGVWLEGVSLHGLAPTESAISEPVPLTYLADVGSIFECSNLARASIEAHPVHNE